MFSGIGVSSWPTTVSASVSAGSSATAATVTKKVWVDWAPLASALASVMVVVPDWFGAASRLMVRSAPVPPSWMLALGSSAVLDELAVTVNWVTGVSSSPKVKGIVTAA